MLIGLIANPNSSKDIRRLTGLARVADAEEKANLMARLLIGIGSEPRAQVLALDDHAGLVRRAINMAGRGAPPVTFLDLHAAGEESDTIESAGLLDAAGADVLVVLGGDGTIRAAVEGWPKARLVPLAAGTNNAFARDDEPTVTGLAVVSALAAGGAGSFSPTTAVHVETTRGSAVAVIDAVSVRNRWFGAGALWEPELLVEAVVTSGRPTSVGIASVCSRLGGLEPGHARHISFGPGVMVRAVFGPGLVRDLEVADFEDLPLGSTVAFDATAGVLALDGERRLVSADPLVTVVEGPLILDTARALRV